MKLGSGYKRPALLVALRGDEALYHLRIPQEGPEMAFTLLVCKY